MNVKSVTDILKQIQDLNWKKIFKMIKKSRIFLTKPK